MSDSILKVGQLAPPPPPPHNSAGTDRSFVARIELEQISNGYLVHIAMNVGERYEKVFIDDISGIVGVISSYVAAKRIKGE